MKLSSTLFGSVLGVMFFAQIGCSGADYAAAPDQQSSEADLKKANHVKFADFKSDADSMAEGMRDGSECSFSTSSAAGKLTLTVNDGKSSTQIVASPSDAVTLTSTGDSTRVYEIAGVGTLTLVEADDAFVSATILSSATKTTSSCEIDF